MDPEECTCHCHTTNNTMHMFACCMTCENCGRHINYESWESHRARCLQKPIIDKESDSEHSEIN